MTANLPLPAASPVAVPTLTADGDAVGPSPAQLTPLSRSTQGLLLQLRNHYPTGCLVSELLQIQAGKFVVRALVQVEGVTVVTAMAAAEQIEWAEDMAQLRALAILGIVPPLVPTSAATSALGSADDRPSQPLVETGNDGAAPIPATAAAGIGALANHPEALMTLPPIAQVVLPVAKLVTIKPAAKQSATGKAAVKVSAPELAPTPTAVMDQAPALESVQEALIPPSILADSIPPVSDEAIERPTMPPLTPGDFSHAADPIDLSDAIAQIGTEIERIGWNKKQGSAHLQKTYSKRTRAELTEEELLEFLSYLKSLPSKEPVGLSPVPF